MIGRPETGDFIAVPDAAHRVITLLGEGCTVDEAASRLRAETGTQFAVADFVAALDDLGFVGSVGDAARADPPGMRPSLPWLHPGHVRWLLHPLAPVVAAAFAVVVIVMIALHPALMPSYRVLVWNRHAGLVLAVNAAIGWSLVLLHEFAHLATARAANAPARISLSTRLQFLVAQTDVSGVWAEPRRSRMTVYLAGMAVNIWLAGTFLLILGLADPHGLLRSLLTVAVAENLLTLPIQLMVFMRTDLYFVLQDLSGCSNLYVDGSAYLAYLGHEIIRRVRPATGGRPDPTRDLRPSQRRAIRGYSSILFAGTMICLGVELAVSLPALILLLVRAVSEMGTSPAGTADGCVALVILLTWQALWTSRWWQRHRRQVRALVRKTLVGERR